MKSLLDFLGEKPYVTKTKLKEWRADLKNRGYAEQTIGNYVKYLNRYLDFVGCSAIRFNKGRAKNIKGLEFGFLTAIEPTDKKYRGDTIWRCRCRCGNYIDVPVASLTQFNTMSCGCLHGKSIARANMYIDDTSLTAALNNTVTSSKSESGYKGVTRKRDKWHAYITYKGKRYSLGSYEVLKEAVAARAAAKAMVVEDATKLLAEYNKLHENDPELPTRSKQKKYDFSIEKPRCISKTDEKVRRIDNTSGHTGIYKRRGKWVARICHQGYRYNLGAFNEIDTAIDAQNTARMALEENAEAFIAEYLKTKKRYSTK